MKKTLLLLSGILFIILCSFQGSMNNWAILKAVQYNVVADSMNLLGLKGTPIKNPTILAIDGTTITLKGYFHKVPGAPTIFNKILFSQHDSWNWDCLVGQPSNYTLGTINK